MGGWRVFVVLLALALALALLASHAVASPGDYSPAYNRCVSTCALRSCPPSASYPVTLPLSLRLTGWTCPQNCAYECMHSLTAKALLLPKAVSPPGKTFEGWWEEPDWTVGSPLEGIPPGRMVQFHGKWPFKRLLGMQEPASVFFSLLNWWGYWSSWSTVKKATQHGSARWLRTEYLGLVVLGLNAWFWSAVFHTRDLPWTEKADYFSAGLYSLWSTYLAVVRTLGWYKPSKSKLRRAARQITAILFVGHVTYLCLRERFDYTYNIIANVVLSIMVMFLWLRWTLLSYWLHPHAAHRNTSQASRPRPPHFLGTIVPSVWLLSAGALELLDFPPVYGVDAHALWHLATVPLAPFWCKGFLATDARWVAATEGDGEAVGKRTS